MSHYEDATPTWSGLLPIYLDVLADPDASFEARKRARETIEHIAHLADKHVARLRADNLIPAGIKS